MLASATHSLNVYRLTISKGRENTSLSILPVFPSVNNRTCTRTYTSAPTRATTTYPPSFSYWIVCKSRVFSLLCDGDLVDRKSVPVWPAAWTVWPPGARGRWSWNWAAGIMDSRPTGLWWRPQHPAHTADLMAAQPFSSHFSIISRVQLFIAHKHIFPVHIRSQWQVVSKIMTSQTGVESLWCLSASTVCDRHSLSSWPMFVDWNLYCCLLFTKSFKRVWFLLDI